MSFVPVTEGDPSKAKGTKRIALVTALRELAGGGWHDRGQVEEAMAKASTLAERTCRNHLRDWTNYGLLATDTGYSTGKGYYSRPPRVALTVLGRAWAIEKGLVRAPAREGVSENRRSEAPSGRVSDKGAGQGTRPGISQERGGVPPALAAGSVGRSPELVVSSLEGETLHGQGQDARPDFDREFCDAVLCDRKASHPGNHMLWNAKHQCWERPPTLAA